MFSAGRYSNALIAHGDAVLSRASRALKGKQILLAAKVPVLPVLVPCSHLGHFLALSSLSPRGRLPPIYPRESALSRAGSARRIGESADRAAREADDPEGSFARASPPGELLGDASQSPLH